MNLLIFYKRLATCRLFYHTYVKNSLKIRIYISKLRFFNCFCLVMTKNTYRTKVSIRSIFALRESFLIAASRLDALLRLG